MGLGTWLKNLFNSLLRAFWSFLKIIYPVAKALLMAELLDFAKSIVKDLNFSDLTNEEKRKEAFKRIKVEAVTRGSKIRDHMIYDLIEKAVGWFKIKGEF